MEKVEKRPDLILTSDFHLREDTPTCWTGDFQMEQWDSVKFVNDLQQRYTCPVVHAGDLFHHWKPSPWLLSTTMEHLPKEFYSIFGQHDLPQHNMNLDYKSGMFTLAIAEKIHILPGAHWGDPIDNILDKYMQEEKKLSFPKRKILVWHHLTYQAKPFPGASDGMAGGILRKYPQFDLIVTGDNHQSFVEEYEGRILVNPGSLTRQKADQMDFRPRVYLWYADTNRVKPVYIPIADGVITREHIKEK